MESAIRQQKTCVQGGGKGPSFPLRAKIAPQISELPLEKDNNKERRKTEKTGGNTQR